MVFTSWQTLPTFNPQITSLCSSQPENPVNRGQPYCRQEVNSHFHHAQKAKLWEKGLLFAISVGRMKTERKRGNESKQSLEEKPIPDRVDNQANNLEEKHELIVSSANVGGFGTEGRQTYAMHFAFSVSMQSQILMGYPSKRTDALFKLVPACSAAGRSRELTHVRGSLSAAQHSTSSLDLLIPVPAPAFPCLPLPAWQRCGWHSVPDPGASQSSQQSCCHGLAQGPEFGQPLLKASQRWALLPHQCMASQKINLLHIQDKHF